jgi:uncharacterized protein (TIRG00374 family)
VRRLILTVVGVCVLAYVLGAVDLADLKQAIESAGWGTFVLIGALFLLYFAADVVNWQAAMPSVRRDPRWFARLWWVRMVGDAYNNVTPTALLGEAIKAWLLKRHYAIAYRETAGAIAIARTSTMFALVLFAAVGALLLWLRPGANARLEALAAGALCLVAIGTLAIYLLQERRLMSRLAQRLPAHAHVRRAIEVIEGIERRIADFYRDHRGALAVSISAACVAWVLGAVELWIVLHALDVPIGFGEAWIVEAFVQSVRAASFFLPAGLGAQEAATWLMLDWMLAAPTAGVAAAIIRRARELIWIALGLTVGVAVAGGRPALTVERDAALGSALSEQPDAH